jgi:hypothetical protein
MKNPKNNSLKILKFFLFLKFEKKSLTFFSAKNFFPPKTFFRQKKCQKKVFGVFNDFEKHFPHTHTILENFSSKNNKLLFSLLINNEFLKNLKLISSLKKCKKIKIIRKKMN